MASVLPAHPGWQLWFLGEHLDFPCCDPVGVVLLGSGAFLGWSGLPPWHFGPQCPILLHLEQWESHAGQFSLPGRVLSRAVGAVLRGCRWCVTIAIVAGVGHLPLILADCIHRLGTVGDLFPGMLDSKMVHSNVCQLTRGCLEWLCHKFPKELSLVAVGMDDMAKQLMLAVLIVDHLTVVHQGVDVCNEILGVLS